MALCAGSSGSWTPQASVWARSLAPEFLLSSAWPRAFPAHPCSSAYSSPVWPPPATRSSIAEEVRDPRRTIPRAIMITIGGALLLYFAVALAALGMGGAPALVETTSPLLVAARASGPPWDASVIATGAVTAMLGVIFSQVLGLSRIAFALARRGDLPRALAVIHPQWSVPGRAVLFVGAVAAIVAATATLRSVAAAASLTILVYYAIANLAALRMRKEVKLYPDLIPAVGLFSCVLLAVSLPLGVISIGSLLLAAGFALRYGVRAAG